MDDPEATKSDPETPTSLAVPELSVTEPLDPDDAPDTTVTAPLVLVAMLVTPLLIVTAPLSPTVDSPTSSSIAPLV
jgi:hypothetical protein